MLYLFSRRALAQLKPYLGNDTLLAFDFDGTLAPLVANPSLASLPRRSASLLADLSKKFPVALVSGRSRADLRPRSPFPLKAWIGNHGMEGVTGARTGAKNNVRLVKQWEKTLKLALADHPAVVIENKKYSLTLHYRASRNRARAKKLLNHLVTELTPAPQIIEGKCILNLLPQGSWNKGTALVALLESGGYRQAIFVGDDVTDEDVFRRHDPRIFSVRIGTSKNSAAQAFLRNQKEMELFLRLLLTRESN